MARIRVGDQLYDKVAIGDVFGTTTSCSPSGRTPVRPSSTATNAFQSLRANRYTCEVVTASGGIQVR